MFIRVKVGPKSLAGGTTMANQENYVREIKIIVTKIAKATHGGDWQTGRSCERQDLILVSEGLQCTNCGKVMPGLAGRKN